MSFLNDIKGKAEALISGNSQAVKHGIEKVGDFIDSKTGGKHSGHVDKAQQAASDYVSGLDRDASPADQARKEPRAGDTPGGGVADKG